MQDTSYQNLNFVKRPAAIGMVDRRAVFSARNGVAGVVGGFAPAYNARAYHDA